MVRAAIPRCFWEQIENKGVAGKECERVRNALIINDLIESTNSRRTGTDGPVRRVWCAERAIRGSIWGGELYTNNISIGWLLRQPIGRNARQFLPSSQESARDTSDGAGGGDHVWTVEEMLGRVGC
jgi:hypothetical protein